jgi:hypothetical protein
MHDSGTEQTLVAAARHGQELGVSAPSVVAVGTAWATPQSAWALRVADGHGNVVGVRLRHEHEEHGVCVPPAKDVREFVRLGGTRAMIENTLHNTIWNT